MISISPFFAKWLFSQYFEIEPEDIIRFQEEYQRKLLERYIGGR